MKTNGKPDPLALEPAESIDLPPWLLLHRLIRGRYVLAVLLALVVGAGGALAGFMKTRPVHESAGTIEVSPTKTSVLSEERGSAVMYRTFIESQVELLKNQTLISRAYEEIEWPPGVEAPANLSNFTKGYVIRRSGRLSDKIDVSYRHANGELCQRAVRALINVYVSEYSETVDRDESTVMKALRARDESLRGEIEKLRAEMLTITREYGGVKPFEDAFMAKTDFVRDLESNIQQQELAIGILRAGQATEAPGAPSPRPDSRVAEVESERLRLRQQLAAKRASLGAKHREVVQLESALAALELELADLPAAMPDVQLTPDMDAAVASQEKKVAILRTLHKKARGELSKMVEVKLAVDTLQGRHDDLEEKLAITTSKIEEREVEAAAPARIKVISDGGTPALYKDSRMRNAVGLAVAGMMFGVGFIALIGAVDRRYRFVDEAEGSELHLAVLGMIPELDSGLRDFERAAVAAHGVHRIRTVIQQQAKDGPLVLGVTSPMSGDGKTSVALALGLSFAGTDARVLVIDFDVVGGGMTRLIGDVLRSPVALRLLDEGDISRDQLAAAVEMALEDGSSLPDALVKRGVLDPDDPRFVGNPDERYIGGLIEVFRGRPLKDWVAATSWPGLYCLPVGDTSYQDIAKLKPDPVRNLLNQAKRDFDVIIVDTGPTPGSIEACLLAPQVDAMLLTISRGSNRGLVQRTALYLERAGATVMGLVFNRAGRADVRTSTSSTSQMSNRSTKIHEKVFSGGDLGRREGLDRFGLLPMVTALSIRGERIESD